MRATLPLLVTTDLRLNTPRYATIQGIMKAKTKPTTVETLESLGLIFGVHSHLKQYTTIVQLDQPTKTKQVKMLSSVDELADVIKKYK